MVTPPRRGYAVRSDLDRTETLQRLLSLPEGLAGLLDLLFGGHGELRGFDGSLFAGRRSLRSISSPKRRSVWVAAS